MATVPCNTGFSESAKFAANEAADPFVYIAVGKGTGQGAANNTLASECDETNMTRFDASANVKTVTTTVANDTYQSTHTYTAGESVHVTEAGAFNNENANAGDMLMVGDLAPSANMASSDTLALTLECKFAA